MKAIMSRADAHRLRMAAGGMVGMPYRVGGQPIEKIGVP